MDLFGKMNICTSAAQIKNHSLLVPTFELKNMGKSLDMWRKFCNFALLFYNKEPMNAEEYCQKPFTLHFFSVSR